MRVMNVLRRAARGARGTTLLEVLVAVLILALLLVGILQMFSLALQVNQGAAARTFLTYKAEQVVEAIRLYQYAYGSGLGGSVPAGSDIPILSTTAQPETTPYYLPYSDTEANFAAQMAFWGPQCANVVEGPNMPYKLSYTISDNGTTWVVVVTAVPVQTAPNLTTQEFNAAAAQNNLMVGSGIRNKKVEYVAAIKK